MCGDGDRESEGTRKRLWRLAGEGEPCRGAGHVGFTEMREGQLGDRGCEAGAGWEELGTEEL